MIEFCFIYLVFLRITLLCSLQQIKYLFANFLADSIK